MAVSRLHPSPPPPTQHQHQQHHHHHIASTLMSCVRESSPVEELEDAAEDSAECGIGGAGGGGGGVEGRKQGRHETKKRRFHPLRGLRRIFRRKSRRSPEDGDRDALPQASAVASSSSYGGGGTLNGEESRDSGGPGAGDLDEAYRSRSASELLSGEEEEEEEGSPGGSSRRRGSGGIASGEVFQDSLRHSVSHDSVFSSGERRVSSGGAGGGGGGGRPAQPLAPSSSAQQVAAHQGVRAELFDAVRRRRWRSRSKDREEENEADRETGEAAAAGRSSDDEEDLGLPRSPCNSPSSGEAGLRSDQKEIQSKSHSTCSEGSLLSMGSSDMDEDSQGHFSGHSSKLSLHEKSSSQYGSDLELDVGAMAEPLSHSAARHKMSIRPKRTHGAPRLRHLKEVTSLGSLPTTPEVNEDSGRCSSPEISFNQETSSTEHIQVPSENSHLKSASMPTAVAVEMPQRVSQGRPMASSPKSEPPLSCLPESFCPTLKPFINPLLHPSLGSDKIETKEIEISTEDVYVSQTKVENTPSRNASGFATCSDADNGVIEEVIGMEESDGSGTTLLSRLLSWRGSKKKIDEPSEGATAAVEGTPSRRMDVHGRYVHEVIPDTQIASPEGMDQAPPSPGWRPGAFSTSWPPIHSTPRSCHTSTRYIPTDREDNGSCSGPHSLPLMMQYGPTELAEDNPLLDKNGANWHMFSSPPSAFPVGSRNKLPPAHDETQVDVTLQKSLSFKAYKQERQHEFSSSEAPDSLPIRFEGSAFESDYPMPSVESLVKVDTSEVSMIEKEFSQRETFMMTSVEGLLTLDVSGTSETKMCDTSEEEVSRDFDADADAMDGGAQEEWDRGAEEEILFNSCIMVPEDGNVVIVDDLEQKVMLHHTKMEQADEDTKCIPEKSNDFIQIEDTYESTSQKNTEAQPASEDQNFSMASTPLCMQKYKRTQSMPIATMLSQPSDVPEFLRVQLIHVDSRPATNVVLHSTGGVPVPVNPPDSCDVPGRRRLRPRSADSLDSNQSGSRDLVSVTPMAKSRITDVVSSVDNERVGSTAGITSNDKENLIEDRCKASIRESIGRFSQSEDSRPKETTLPCATPQKVSEETSDRVVNVVGTPPKEKEETVEQFHKALIRECSEITIQNEENRRESTTPFRAQRKVSEDATNKSTNVPVVSMKDKEEAKFKVPVRESLGMISVQNSENRLKDASLPPKAQRKILDESTAEVVTRRKSTISKDLVSQNPVDDLPPKAQRKVSEESSAEVVPRRKSTASKDLVSQNKDDEPELFKVFARRSLKLKDSETWESHPPPQQQQQQRSRDSDKENEVSDNTMDVVILPIAKEQKLRESLIKPEFLRQIDPLVKPSVPMQTDMPPQLQRISPSNGLLPSAAVSGGNGSMQPVYGNEKSAGVVSEIPRVHRSSIGGSLPRREGPSPEKRARGVSVNLLPESQPFRADASRGAAVSSEPRRPLWATQIHSDELNNGKTVSSDVSDQNLDLGFRGEDDLKPHFKGIQQRKEEWELRARMQ